MPTSTSGRSSRYRGTVSGFVLKLARQTAALTQERLAEAVGADVTTVQAWESGRRPLSALQTGDLLRLRNCLLRLGAPSSTGRHLREAIEVDVVLSLAIEHGGVGAIPDPHPLAAAVHRHSLINLLTWPFTGVTPGQLDGFVSRVPRRGPEPLWPTFCPDEQKRFFDHLLAVADRCVGPDQRLLRRQAVYLLGFGKSAAVKTWLHDEWTRTSGRKIEDGDVAELLAKRSASIALAVTGDAETLCSFVRSTSGGWAETANLNYWAYWTGELVDDQADDRFIAELDPRCWGGQRLAWHLVNRLGPETPQLTLNLDTLYSLVVSRPSLLSERPRLRRRTAAALERLDSGSELPGYSREQLAGLRYAVRLADR
ncbi:multiprotein-bridging factor 1 family protein [Amycolatopsis sp. NPDC058986]|uniref:helix-turn-helix domain-containing protein n=1 Tax=unclassified Amycolatopsis TaxID=2618356 RepID=UPI00366D5878